MDLTRRMTSVIRIHDKPMDFRQISFLKNWDTHSVGPVIIQRKLSRSQDREKIHVDGIDADLPYAKAMSKLNEGMQEITRIEIAVDEPWFMLGLD